jgi:manganese efflux pump family protein
MGFFNVFLIAIGLSFDSFAVSVSSGLAKKKIDFYDAMKIAFSLSFFQALMPLLGYWIGVKITPMIRDADHWIAFGLLFILGLKMIRESMRKKDGTETFNPLNVMILVGMSLATSIDAFVVGISFGFLEVNIVIALAIIGVITFIISMLGILFGKKTGGKSGKKMEIIGGLILIGIGIKILLEHLMAA